MITNTKVTIYNKAIDAETKLNVYTKTIYDAWCYFKNKAKVSEGLANDNFVVVRIPYSDNIGNFAIGDIIYIGEGNDIESQNDLGECYIINSITENLYGENKHIHIEGK